MGGEHWVDFIGFSLALTAGSLYWIVLKNGNGTPTTNYPSVAYGPADSIPSLAAGISGGFPTWGSSLYSGSWTANVNGYSCLRLKYSDGNYDGLPLQAAISLQGVNEAATGVKFTMPSNSGISYSVVGVALGFDGAAGTPAGQPLYGLYLGASAIVPTISTIPIGMSGQWFNNGTNAPAWFSAPVAIPGGSIVRLAVTESSWKQAKARALWARVQHGYELSPAPPVRGLGGLHATCGRSLDGHAKRDALFLAHYLGDEPDHHQRSSGGESVELLIG